MLKKRFLVFTIIGLFIGISILIPSINGEKQNKYMEIYNKPNLSIDCIHELQIFDRISNLQLYSIYSGPNTNNVKWKCPTGDKVISTPVVSNGFVYVGSNDNYLYCINENLGLLKWRFKTGGDVASSPAVISGKVYFGSYDNYMYCINTYDKSEIWSLLTGGDIFSSPKLDSNKVYFGSSDGNVYCLNANSGKKVWINKTEGEVLSSPCVFNYKVYIGSNDGNLYCFNAVNGTEIWRFETGLKVVSSPFYYNGKVYFGSYNKYVYCVNALTGEEEWSYKTNNAIESSPTVNNGMVYIGSDDGYLYCLNSETGFLIWSFPTNGWILSSPKISDDKVYFGSNDNHVYCLDSNTGEEIWRYKTGNDVWSSPFINGDRLYIGSNDYHVYCFEDNGCCFPAGTKITMADDSYKNIEDIKLGDCVKSYDIDTGKSSKWIIKMLGNPIHPVCEINDGLISTTVDHPFYIKKPNEDIGWGAIDTERSTRANICSEKFLQIEVGDKLFNSDEEWIDVKKIEYNDEFVQTYNILSFSGTRTYYANNILVYEEHPPDSFTSGFLENLFERFPKISQFLLSLPFIEKILIPS